MLDRLMHRQPPHQTYRRIPKETRLRIPANWNQNSTKTREQLYNRNRATPNLAKSVMFPKSAVRFAEIRTSAYAWTRHVLALFIGGALRNDVMEQRMALTDACGEGFRSMGVCK